MKPNPAIGPEASEVTSIFSHIWRHLPEQGPGLLDGGGTLPDEPERQSPGGLRWAPGALEGVMTHHVSDTAGAQQRQVERVYDALVRLVNDTSAGNRAEVETLLRQSEARSLVDPLIAKLEAEPPVHLARLYEEVGYFLRTSPHREVVKLSIAIRALFGQVADLPVFRIFGRHDEFTLYVAIAISRVMDDPIPEWIDLARSVTGWGRIELVNLLLKYPQPRVCAFLLREGYVNDVDYGYTALAIASGCQLQEALQQFSNDRQLLDGARSILGSLIAAATDGGVDGDILDYEHSGIAVERFLTALRHDGDDLASFVTVHNIRDFAARDFDDVRLLSCGWDPLRRNLIVSLCDGILAEPRWLPKIRKEVSSVHRPDWWTVLNAARRTDFPVRQYILARLEAVPADAQAWYEICRDTTAADLDEVLAAAWRLLDIEAITTGPANETGLGEQFWRHNSLSIVVQALARFPGTGQEFILMALKNPVIRLRHMALGSLATWPVRLITEDLLATLEACRDDPNEGVRNKCLDILMRIQQGESADR